MMKHFLCVSMVLTTVLGGCTSTKTYTINGTWENGNGQTVYIQDGVAGRDDPYIDSISVTNGVFTVGSELPGKIITLSPGRSGPRKAVIFEEVPVNITAVTDEENGKVSLEVEQTPEQVMLADVQTRSLTSSLLSLAGMIAMSEVVDDPVKLDSVSKATTLLQEELYKAFTAELDSATNIMASAYAIETLILPDKPISEGVHYYGQLSQRVKDSHVGLQLKTRIDELQDVNIGGVAPDIDLPGPDGKTVKLSSLRGKYVLLDFWASWCGPCLREVPNVKAIYDKYRDKGFEVYGVSLDDAKQENDWKAAIEKYGMDWVHVSSLKGWECPAARRYAVTGIPKMYLLDKEGKIIAMDLRGEKLREKVASLLE